MNAGVLNSALQELLCCPGCYSTLNISGTKLRCTGCSKYYLIDDGVICFLDATEHEQRAEQSTRDAYMKPFERAPRDAILKLVARHHSLAVMSRRAAIFRRRFGEQDWILDIGGGSGWCWHRTHGGQLALLDFSLQSLKSARQILSESDRAILIWANAQALPIRDQTISGVWSVQVFQHFPAQVFQLVRRELARVLTPHFLMEIYNLNPASLHRHLYGLLGKSFHIKGRLGEMELNRLTIAELLEMWKSFRPHLKHSSGYSELFFHPDFGFRPRPYPMFLEMLLTDYIPGVASAFARQVHVRLETE